MNIKRELIITEVDGLKIGDDLLGDVVTRFIERDGVISVITQEMGEEGSIYVMNGDGLGDTPAIRKNEAGEWDHVRDDENDENDEEDDDD